MMIISEAFTSLERVVKWIYNTQWTNLFINYIVYEVTKSVLH